MPAEGTTPFRAGQTIVLGFTGSLGSGCTFMAEGIKDVLGANGHYYRLSGYIRRILREGGNANPTTEQMQDEGNRLRREHGLQYLVEKCVADIQVTEDAGALDANSVILIDGIRNKGEVATLRTSPNFYLVSVHATRDRRRDRLVGTGPGKRFGNEADFDKADKRDSEEDDEWGQKVQICSDLADIIVNNEDDIPVGAAARTAFFTDFITKYVIIMKALRDGNAVPDRPPSMDETLMTMAFCDSLRSSCAKRKVGAAIALVKKFPIPPERVKRAEDDKRYHVVASGHNEVPLGTPPCQLSGYAGCYRDSLKRRISESFRHCPQCGEEIAADFTGDYEKLRDFRCSCGKELKTCLPGSGDETGKLLDMCKALHAEENAILGLAGVSKDGDGKLVLYTTTFPCNLCANKIVEAGIKIVVYAEPYPMKDAKRILEDGGVEVKKFQGVKSSAYFRIYAM